MNDEPIQNNLDHLTSDENADEVVTVVKDADAKPRKKSTAQLRKVNAAKVAKWRAKQKVENSRIEVKEYKQQSTLLNSAQKEALAAPEVVEELKMLRDLMFQTIVYVGDCGIEGHETPILDKVFPDVLWTQIQDFLGRYPFSKVLMLPLSSQTDDRLWAEQNWPDYLVEAIYGPEGPMEYSFRQFMDSFCWWIVLQPTSACESGVAEEVFAWMSTRLRRDCLLASRIRAYQKRPPEMTPVSKAAKNSEAS